MRLMCNCVRERLAAGAVVTGVIVFTGRPVVVELAACAGLDFVILDREHSALDLGADLFVNSVTRLASSRSMPRHSSYGPLRASGIFPCVIGEIPGKRAVET